MRLEFKNVLSVVCPRETALLHIDSANCFGCKLGTLVFEIKEDVSVLVGVDCNYEDNINNYNLFR